MTHKEKKLYLINRLLSEQAQYKGVQVSSEEMEQSGLLRSLMNVRYPNPIDKDFLEVQDEYLQAVTMQKGVIVSDEENGGYGYED